MLSILINAYACSPNMGSEPGMAWNWCVNLAKHCELHIITEGEFQDKIEAVVPTLPQGKNMHFYYNPVSDEIRKMCWNQGDWRFYKYYKEWQGKTYEMARDICRHTHIDILHQLNMIGFREPGYLWKISDVPFVWGPVDAKEKFPVAYLAGAGLKIQLFMKLKNFLTGIQLRYSQRVHQAVERASVVVSASSNSQQAFKKFFHIDSPLLNETGCYVQEHPIIDKTQKDTLDVLWVGKMDFRKQLGLAIQSIAKTANPRIKLHIVGGGDSVPYQTLAKELNIDKQCKWHGTITHNEVLRIMQKSDVFLFTSVAEGTPHVVLEAIGNNLPVLCFNTCGQGDSVNEKVGHKIELTNPQQSIKDFAEALNRFENNRNLLKTYSINCKARQLELSWDNKAKQMVELYTKIIFFEKATPAKKDNGQNI
ncbi:glycosyltransferase [Bacteroides sp. An51A]|uniref:glycosyltransferase family 4 protein n=1 Tax=Bacteroides sp. An51A TaxID=1965640 RepID=UPI000B376200|nr:glycosyltransferase [Bacteroides sp. An51A]OUN80485.1 glycosyl transferase family 1 [Bacteroides sp. An51A]